MTTLSHEARRFDWLITDFVRTRPESRTRSSSQPTGCAWPTPRASHGQGRPARRGGRGTAEPDRGRLPGVRGRRGVADRGGDAARAALVMAISDGSVLAVLAWPDCDMGLVAYQMTLLVDRAGQALTPALRAELQASRTR